LSAVGTGDLRLPPMHEHDSDVPASEPRSLQPDLRSGPRRLEVRLDLSCLFRLALGGERIGEAAQTPTIVRPLLERPAIDGLRLGSPAALQEECAQVIADQKGK